MIAKTIYLTEEMVEYTNHFLRNTTVPLLPAATDGKEYLYILAHR